MEPSTDYVPDPRRWRILFVMMVALFMSLIAISIVNVALPSIQHSLNASDSQLQWILAGYTLTFGMILVAAGRAGDIFGRGPLFIAGVAIFTAASIACALAGDATTLNIARAVQGIGSGLLNPQGVGMVQQYFRGAERARAFGYFGAAVGVSVAIGPLLGGVLIDAGGPVDGWRWTFFVNVPFGILAIVLAWLWIPKPLLTRRGTAARQPRPGPDPGGMLRSGLDRTMRSGRQWRRALASLDPIGSLLLGLAVLAVLLPFAEGRTSAWSWLALPVGVALTLYWLRWERRYKRSGREPMVDLAIFRIRSFANGTLLITLYFVGITSIWVLIAMYFQNGLGHSAVATGMVGLPSSILSGVAALWGGRSVARHGRNVVIFGIWVLLLGLVTTIGVVHLHAAGRISEWWLLLTLSFLGIAQGAVISPNQALTLEEVPLSYAGSAGGVMQTGQRIGSSIGITMLTALAFVVLARSDWTWAFNAGFAAITLIGVGTLVIAYRDRHARRHRRSRPGGGRTS